ncbi:MAG: outer membrane lipoprotein carrier protein LolA, partial [Myxococcales bacterium]|nr:outer membrane lipoprotein carrier protein LolA [Myxococcales bacterium]
FVIALRPDSTATTARLDLVPRVPTSDYSRLRLVIDRATSRITETTIVDALGNTNTITFTNLRYNAGVDPAIFVADIPSGFTRISVPDDGG